VFLPYKNAPAKTFLTDSASSREAEDQSRNPVAFSSSSSSPYHSQRKVGLAAPQSTKPSNASKSRQRPHLKSTVNVEAEVTSALRRPNPFKGGECSSFFAFDYIKCGFSPYSQEECDDEFETVLPGLDMLLRTGRQDPFRQYPVPSIGRYADELMDYG
jgi:hypothetical protein